MTGLAGHTSAHEAQASGSELKIEPWSQRKRKILGEIVPGRPMPLIDQVLRLMHLWKEGDVNAVDQYAKATALRQNQIFPRLPQAPIELSPAGSDERATLESISNHLVGRGVIVAELIALAHGYGRQVSDFVRQRPRVESFDPQFRGPVKPSDADQARIAQQVALFKDLCQLYLELEELTASPMVRRYPAEYDTAGLSAEQAAESIALEERNRLRLGSGPVPQVRDVLENDVGLRIFYLDLPNGYSEIYVYTEQLGACLAINRLHPPERRRWSLLHGYAHFLVHRGRAVVEADGAYQRNPAHERIADAFARFFLMPTEGLVRRYNDIRQSKGKVTLVDLCVLAYFYGASMQALVLRLEELRLISAGKWAELQHDGLKVRDLQARAGVEPLSERDGRYPLRYQLLAVEALDDGVISEGQFAQFLELSRVESRRQAELLRQQDDVASVDSLACSAGSGASALSEVREERA